MTISCLLGKNTSLSLKRFKGLIRAVSRVSWRANRSSHRSIAAVFTTAIVFHNKKIPNNQQRYITTMKLQCSCQQLYSYYTSSSIDQNQPKFYVKVRNLNGGWRGLSRSYKCSFEINNLPSYMKPGRDFTEACLCYHTLCLHQNV